MTDIVPVTTEKLLSTVITETTTVVVSQPEYVGTITSTEPEFLVVEVDSPSKVIVTEPHNIVVEEPLVVGTVVTGGEQGPQGIPGASTQFEYVVAGQVLGGNRAVTVNQFGLLVYPDLTSSTSRVYGITTHSAQQGEVVTVQITGTQIESSWNWDTTMPVFAGTNGILTQTVPVTGQSIVVGYPNSPTKLFIDRQPPIYMG